MALKDYIPWLNMGGDQTNPAVMAQMSQQAAPIGGQPPQASNAQAPRIVPPPASNTSPYTVQPTTQPIGTMPQEMTPSQPTMINPMDLYNRIEALRPRDNSQMMREMALGEKSLGEAKGLQQSEIDKMKEGLAKYAGSERGIDFTPLAALSDSWYGGNLSQAAREMAPESAAKKAQNIAEMQAKITTAQGGLPELEMKSLQNKLAQMGYMDERQNKLEMAKIAAEAKLAGGGMQTTRAGTMQDRLGAQAIKFIHDDELIRKGAGQVNQINLDRHSLAAKVISPQMYDEITTGLANAISGGKASAVTTQERQHFDNAEKRLAEVKQKVSSGVVNVDQPEVKQYLLDTMDRLGEGFALNNYTRAQQKEKGAESAYSHTPSARAAMHAAVESYNPKNLSAPTSTSAVGLDADLSKMSADELKAWLATHGGG